MSKQKFRMIALTALFMGIAGVACAQQFPTKPVRFVAGFAPGGGVDVSRWRPT